MIQHARAFARTRPSAVFGRSLLALGCALALVGCGDDDTTTADAGVTSDGPPSSIDGAPMTDVPAVPGDMGPPVSVDAPPLMLEDAPTVMNDGGTAAMPFCALGADVPGTSVPGGFCLRKFAGSRDPVTNQVIEPRLMEPRTLAFAPNGDLFIGAPMSGTPGGSSGGPGAIVILSDDDHDGAAEVHTFASGIGDIHGITFGDGFIYFTTANDVWRTPYATGQRTETAGARQQLGLPAAFGQGGRWTHGLAHSAGGVLYASRGQYGSCGGNSGGEISRIGMSTMQPVATGFRNPMYLRCHFRDELCAATELGEDGQMGAREKLILLRPQTDYGYPCCFTAGKPAPAGMPAQCAAVRPEDASFVLSDTPFGFDWERELWPDPYRGAVFVALHGSFYSSPQWAGARIVFAHTDPMTHMPTETWRDFVGGFGPGGSVLERPSDVTFAPDGRMFFADDQGGGVYWIAPASLARSN